MIGMIKDVLSNYARFHEKAVTYYMQNFKVLNINFVFELHNIGETADHLMLMQFVHKCMTPDSFERDPKLLEKIVQAYTGDEKPLKAKMAF